MRKFLVAATAAVVVAGGGALVTPAQAAAPTDPKDAAAGWLAAQLTDGAVVGQYGPDYGVSVDTAFALEAIGGHPSDVDAIRSALAGHINDYITGDAFGDTGSTYAGSAAKALVFAESVGADPTSFGGDDLVTRVEGQVTSSGPSQGRLFDTSIFADYANTLGQAYAAKGLAEAGSPRAGDVLDFLLEQQCGPGYFRLNFNSDKNAADQTCDGGRASGDSAPDPDATATVLLQIGSLSDSNARAARAVGRAESWLVSQQHADGSFSGGTSTRVANTNSTGLAGWALGQLGHPSVAEDAAAWVRAHEVQPIAACPTKLATQAGAIAYDDAALSSGRSNGITAALGDQWRRASSQAAPVLQWAPTGTSDVKLSGPTGYVRAGTKATFRVSGVVPGTQLCLTGVAVRGYGAGDLTGRTTLALAMPAGTANRAVTATDGTSSSAFTVKVLGKKKLAVKAPKKVHRGKKATVKVSGLAPHEQLTVRWSGKVVKKAKATSSGKYTVKIKVGKKVRSAKVKVTGQFPAIRSGAKTIKVTR